MRERGEREKKTLIRVIADQLPKPRKQFENEKNALKISDEKVISAINQHMREAKKTSAATAPEKKEKKKLEKKSQKEREAVASLVKIQEKDQEEEEEENIEDMTEGKK